MSRYLTEKEDGTRLEEIESMDICKWNINDVCCNDKCDCLGDFPYPRKVICSSEDGCEYFEKEDGVIDE